ncbi:uncharacterized protein LOC125494808 [Beta vulgaris subsp. vulgaris]|uniref:uncharacterized protein LOC125494808 n=1 Tax=Beta vulgaris subsp. vulgaris TaxID=3555 RepID=UPI0020371BC6|nr:uncharacterized protein LOC125494808 [Beta vulgaris subsp. vulgaris]
MDRFGCWDRALITQLVPLHIADKIGSLFLPSSPQDDSLVWGLTADGEYSVKFGSLLAQGIYNPNFEKVEFAWLWKFNVPPKIKLFLWKACHDGLPSKDRLKKCKVFVPYWIEEWHSISDGASISKFSFVWWFIWFTRNKVIFNEEGFTPCKVSFMISSFFAQWLKAAAKGEEDVGNPSPRCSAKPKVVRVGKNIVWTPPPENFCKLDLNGLKDPNGNAALGFVIRDCMGEVLLVGAKSLGPHISIVQVEAWALCEGVKGAISLDISHLVVEGDNLAVINSMKNLWRIPWEISNIINDVGVDARSFVKCQFRHCFREANQAADFMAKKAHRHQSLLYWFPPYCMDFSLIIRKDVLGWPPD